MTKDFIQDTKEYVMEDPMFTRPNGNQYKVIGTRNDPRIGSCPWFWKWFWRPFYLLYKGMFGHFVIWCLTFWTIIVPIIYIVKARDLVFYNMQKKGMLR